MNDYGNVAQRWSEHDAYNAESTEKFFSLIPEDLQGQCVVDFGCGPGDDMITLQERGAQEVVGVDTSKEMVQIARAKGLDVRWCGMENSSVDFFQNHYDWVVSKWALQAVSDYELVYYNASRLLKRGGILVFLVVHPVRQFMEKKWSAKNYFQQDIVDSIIFDGQLTFREPSHTFRQLISPFFLKLFDLTLFEEGVEKGCEKVGGNTYPGYALIKAQKR